MKFLIIVPAHNEEDNILQCLESLKTQTFQDFLCIIVNDGSTDKTGEIIGNFTRQNSNFHLKNLPKSNHRPGAKVVEAFYKGISEENLDNFDIICKFDSDIVFPKEYLAELNHYYEKNPSIGMLSGLIYIKKSENWEFENLSSKNHVRGPIKSYRLQCYKDIGGLKPVLGWDNIDVMLAEIHNWKVVTIKKLCVKHLRPTAFNYKSQKAEKLGEYFYNIGLNLPLAIISSAKSSWRDKSISDFFITIKSFMKQKTERKLSKKEILQIRKLRWRKIINSITRYFQFYSFLSLTCSFGFVSSTFCCKIL